MSVFVAMPCKVRVIFYNEKFLGTLFNPTGERMPGTFHYIRRHLFLNKCQTSHFTLLAVTPTYGIFNSSFLLLLYTIARECPLHCFSQLHYRNLSNSLYRDVKREYGAFAFRLSCDGIFYSIVSQILSIVLSSTAYERRCVFDEIWVGQVN